MFKEATVSAQQTVDSLLEKYRNKLDQSVRAPNKAAQTKSLTQALNEFEEDIQGLNDKLKSTLNELRSKSTDQSSSNLINFQSTLIKQMDSLKNCIINYKKRKRNKAFQNLTLN